MADFKPTRFNLSTINNGKGKYNNGDSVQADTINAVVEGTAWVQALGTNQPNNSEVNNVGTPSVSIETLADGTPRLKFDNLKGEKGDTGTGILEYDSKSAFPSIGETGKIYIDKSANLTYRWSGSAYVQVGGGGSTSSVNIVQTTGESETDVMSQKAVSKNFLPAEVSGAEIDINSSADTYVTGHPWSFFNSCSFMGEIDVSKNLKINEYISILNPDTISYENKIYLPVQTGTVVLRPNDLPTETSLVTVSSTGSHAYKKVSDFVDVSSGQTISGSKTFTNLYIRADEGCLYLNNGFIQDKNGNRVFLEYPNHEWQAVHTAFAPYSAPTEPSFIVNAADRTPTWKPVSELGGGGNALKVTVW